VLANDTGDDVAGPGLGRRRERVLEVGDDRVCLRRERLLELALVAARREEERAEVGELGSRGRLYVRHPMECQTPRVLDRPAKVRHKRCRCSSQPEKGRSRR
jgi:hypothetical protein